MVDNSGGSGIIKDEISKVLDIPNVEQIAIPARAIDANKLGFDSTHISESGHNVTRDMAIEWINNSKFSVDVWNNQYTRFFSFDGAVYVNNEKNYIRTAFSKDEYTDNILKALEVIKK